MFTHAFDAHSDHAANSNRRSHGFVLSASTATAIADDACPPLGKFLLQGVVSPGGVAGRERAAREARSSSAVASERLAAAIGGPPVRSGCEISPQ